MLTVETLGAARWHFSENGTPYAEVGTFVHNSIAIEGTTYQLTRTGGQSFALIGGYGPVVTAEWTGKKWSVVAYWQSSRLVLSRPSRWRSVLEIHQDGAPVGTVTIGFGKITADLSQALPLAVRTFLVYVTIMHGKFPPYNETNHYSHGSLG